LFYKSWFKANAFYEEKLKRLSRLPSWDPFKDYQIKQLSDKSSWIIIMRTFSTIFMLAVIIWDIAFFISK
jgi:hypothetical protein